MGKRQCKVSAVAVGDVNGADKPYKLAVKLAEEGRAAWKEAESAKLRAPADPAGVASASSSPSASPSAGAPPSSASLRVSAAPFVPAGRSV